jgi:hypothetical protein
MCQLLAHRLCRDQFLHIESSISKACSRVGTHARRLPVWTASASTAWILDASGIGPPWPTRSRWHLDCTPPHPERPHVRISRVLVYMQGNGPHPW